MLSFIPLPQQMLAVKLAFRNLLGAGLRTWLNVAVLSFAFVVIVFYNGMLDGWNMQALRDTRQWETGNGQLWHPAYDRFDPYTLQDAHQPVSSALQNAIAQKKLAPVLIVQAAAFPQGRMMNVLLKGIEPSQQVLKLPTRKLDSMMNAVPVVIGRRMAATARLQEGDHVQLRWRDKNGTFDAREVVVAKVFDSNVPGIDNGQIWISLETLYEMTGLKNEATMLIAAEQYEVADTGNWLARDENFLLKEYREVMESKKAGSRMIYGLLLAIALLAIFDTQVLAVFRRQKEIGTWIALGLTRGQVVKIFTVEGSAHSILALALGSVYGIPLLYYLQVHGIPMPASAGQTGLSISESIIPVYSASMVISTILLVVISATIVSYFPARRIAKMNPTEAIKGKIQ